MDLYSLLGKQIDVRDDIVSDMACKSKQWFHKSVDCQSTGSQPVLVLLTQGRQESYYAIQDVCLLDPRKTRVGSKSFKELYDAIAVEDWTNSLSAAIDFLDWKREVSIDLVAYFQK